MICPSCRKEFDRGNFDRNEVYFECDDCCVELEPTPQETEAALRLQDTQAAQAIATDPNASREKRCSLDSRALRRDVSKLWNATLLYVSVLAAGLLGILVAATIISSPAQSEWVLRFGFVMVFASLIPYLPAIAFAYLVQDRLYKSGVHSRPGWHVIVVALYLNPFVAGFWPLLRAYFAAKRVLARLSPANGVQTA